mmetsp:Transcript_8720/g.17019  ORF Transcript_8720/g.17019 Transcript_8720/m.17019 type:complete len:140 (-) Transcript_8720:26-445(-)
MQSGEEVYEGRSSPPVFDSPTRLGTANSLKGKLLTLEANAKTIIEEIKFYHKALEMLQAEKNTLKGVIRLKTMEVTSAIDNELQMLRDEMTRLFDLQENENGRLRQYVQGLKLEKAAIQHQLSGMHKRVSELESQIGAD